MLGGQASTGCLVRNRIRIVKSDIITVVAVVADLIHDEAVQSSDNNDDDSGNSSMNTSKNTV